MAKFSKGDLVRKCTESGIPVGPWLKITLANAYQVQVKPAEALVLPLEQTTILDKNHVWKPKVARLCVSKDAIEKLESGSIFISHPVSKAWVDIYEHKPDIILFYSSDGWKKMWCTIEHVNVIVTSQERLIRVIIDRIIKCV